MAIRFTVGEHLVEMVPVPGHGPKLDVREPRETYQGGEGPCRRAEEPSGVGEEEGDRGGIPAA